MSQKDSEKQDTKANSDQQDEKAEVTSSVETEKKPEATSSVSKKAPVESTEAEEPKAAATTMDPEEKPEPKTKPVTPAPATTVSSQSSTAGKADAKSKPTTAAPTPPAKKATPEALMALVVDDEPANRDFLVRLLQQAKMKVRGAGSGQEALKIAKELGESLSLIMLDHQLPDKTGAQLLTDLREHLPNVKIVMATMYDERSMMRDAFKAGCTAFLVKPHGFMDLFKMIEKVVEEPSCLDNLEGKVFDQQGTRDWRG